MSQVVPARLPPEMVRGLNKLVKAGRFSNRSEAVKEATRLLLSSGELPSSAAMAKAAAQLTSVMIAWNTPTVEIIVLYGSLARGTSGPESDVDLLVLLSQGEPWKLRRQLYDLTYPVLASLGVDISLNVLAKTTWEEMLRQDDPLARSIMKEGITLWGSLNRPN